MNAECVCVCVYKCTGACVIVCMCKCVYIHIISVCECVCMSINARVCEFVLWAPSHTDESAFYEGHDIFLTTHMTAEYLFSLTITLQ